LVQKESYLLHGMLVYKHMHDGRASVITSLPHQDIISNRGTYFCYTSYVPLENCLISLFSWICMRQERQLFF